MQATQQIGRGGWANAKGEVTEVPDLIVGGYGLVPALDHRCVHGGDAGEWPAVERPGAGMAKMGVSDEPDGQALDPGRDRD